MKQRASSTTVADLISDGREETLHLEFKTLSSDTTLTRDDRKMIAKAVSGFANAEGGKLVIGVETKKVDGVDLAYRKKPLKNLEKIKRLVSAALPELLSPQHQAIVLTAEPDNADSDQGFLVISIGPSNDRPHMSVPDKRYFRRGSDGTRVLDHGEIRELMFAAREAVLSIDWTLRFGASSADQRHQLFLSLILRNDGRVPVVAPYVRVKDGGSRFSVGSNLQLVPRQSADNTYGIYCPRDILIHLHDEIWIAECGTGLDFRGTGHHHLASAVNIAKQPTMDHTYAMTAWDLMHRYEGTPAKDQVIEVSGFFGAENTPTKEFSFTIGKRILLDRFANLKGLQ